MGRALKQYWKLVVAVLIVSVGAIGFYIIRFYALSISGDPGDWADFATYVSGTVGVAVVAGTLLALIHTLFQQGRLIEQQDDIISRQKEEISLVESHQRRMEAYSRAERFFSELLGRCNSQMHGTIESCVEDFKPYAETPSYASGCKYAQFFESYSFPSTLGYMDCSELKLVADACTDKSWRLLLFMGGCLKPAPELYDYFSSRIGGYRVNLMCALAYKRAENYKRFEEISNLMGYPLDYSDIGGVEKAWQNIGERVFNIGS